MTEFFPNGAVLLERKPKIGGRSDSEIVLCKLPNNPSTPYVTWQRNKDEQSCYWGHYHRDLAAAHKDYLERT